MIEFVSLELDSPGPTITTADPDLNKSGCFQDGAAGACFGALTNGASQGKIFGFFAPSGATKDIMDAAGLVVPPFRRTADLAVPRRSRPLHVAKGTLGVPLLPPEVDQSDAAVRVVQTNYADGAGAGSVATSEVVDGGLGGVRRRVFDRTRSSDLRPPTHGCRVRD